jgi:nucleoside-diphosphate-sugar epimerase
VTDNAAVQQTVLITGAGGFLGGHLSISFREAGWRTAGIGRGAPLAGETAPNEFHRTELDDAAALSTILESVAPDLVVHLAAPADVQRSVRQPREDFIEHVLPTVNLLDALRRQGGAARLILISSAAVYGNPSRLPVPETSELRPISPYGFHKVQQELLVDEHVALWGLRACKARIFSAYGEHLRHLAVWDIARRAMSGTFEVLGTGDETRDYLYAGDIGRVLVCLASRSAFRGEAINVASGREVPLRELASEIYRLAGVAATPRFTGESIPGAPLRWQADVGRLRELGCEIAEWSNGLQRTIDWIRQAPSP